MKNNGKMVIVAVASVLIICISCLTMFQNYKKEKTAFLEFTKYDALDSSKEVYQTLTIKENDIVDLTSDNKITILEINDKNIKISRVVTRYTIISDEERTAEPYEEKSTETIEYGKNIIVDADEIDPFGPDYSAPRYSISVTVLKEKR